MFRLWSAIASIVGHVTAVNDVCTVTDGKNNNGVNLRRDYDAHDGGACCDACAATSACVGYTFVKGSGQCWLKSSLGALTSDAAVVSGSRPVPPTPAPAPPSPTPVPQTCVVSEGQNSNGVNLKEAPSVGDAGQCCDQCLSTLGCVGYTFVKASKECWLKSALGHPTSDTNVVSGTPSSAPKPTPAPGPPTPAPPYHRKPLAPISPPEEARSAGWRDVSGNSGASGNIMLAAEQSAKLLGRTLRMTVDVSQIGCGCVVGIYFVQRGDGNECDASGNRPGRCGEIDLFEGNKYAWHSTLHNAQDHPGNFGGTSGVQQPDMMYGQGPRDFSGEQYGVGGSVIDTTQPFHAAVSFPQTDDGSLADMVVMLHQDGKDKAIEFRVNKKRADASRSPPLTCEDSSCDFCFSKPGCVYKETDLEAFGSWLSSGMSPRSTYWENPGNTWLDGVLDGEPGGCTLGSKGQPGTEHLGSYSGSSDCNGAGYTVKDFTVEDIRRPEAAWSVIFEAMDESPLIDATSFMIYHV